MFDYITCDYPLPMPDEPKGFTGCKDFQTKDLENAMMTYHIDTTGQLYVRGSLRGWYDEDVSEDDKNKLTPENRNVVLFLYDYQTNDDKEFDYSIEYELVILNGKVTNCKLNQFEAIPNSDRRHQQSVWDTRDKIRREYMQTRFYLYFDRPWCIATRWVFHRIHKTLEYLSSKQYFVERSIHDIPSKTYDVINK